MDEKYLDSIARKTSLQLSVVPPREADKTARNSIMARLTIRNRIFLATNSE
ncbi:MAG: hypothetical protein NO516_02715 [Candidatus Methanomethylicia archaeon]|nr:hypothetical protein [Candidatus Methanomethylicia archaeon]